MDFKDFAFYPDGTLSSLKYIGGFEGVEFDHSRLSFSNGNFSGTDAEDAELHGSFYGPNNEEVAGVYVWWENIEGDNYPTVTVPGSFGAVRNQPDEE